MQRSNIYVTVDAAVFGFDGNGLFLLLIKRKNPPFQNTWCLPGGFVDEHEDLQDAAQRELEEETGIRVSHMHQVYAFGKPHRDPRHHTVSVAYVCLLKKNLHEPKGSDDADEAKWFPIGDLPELGFDHAHIVEKSKAKLKSVLSVESVDTESELSEGELRLVIGLI